MLCYVIYSNFYPEKQGPQCLWLTPAAVEGGCLIAIERDAFSWYLVTMLCDYRKRLFFL